jgi:phosphatidate cytidylyltransferase
VLRNRLLVSIFLIPLVVTSVILGGLLLFVVMGGAMILCGYEYFTMLKAGGYRPERALGVVLIAALFVDAWLALGAAKVILVAAVVLPPLWELRRHEHDGFLLNWALTVLGVVYIGLLGAHLFLLRGLAGGTALLGITLMATWAADTAAYSFGVSLGRHPFFKEISPKKTWEGAVGGVAASALAFALLMIIYGLNPVLAFAGGIGLGIFATIGDLVESLIKRQVAIKDSGSMLAGHGGVFDRLDSTLFTVVFAYYFLLFATR